MEESPKLRESEHLFPSVLVVDDSELDCEMLAIACESLNCEIETALSGEEALSKFEVGKFHLVVTDYMMEPMDGIALIDELRKRDPEVECIVVTGSRCSRIMEFIQNDDRVPVMMKPITMQSLLNRVRFTMDRLASRGSETKISLSLRMDQCLPLLGVSEAIGELRSGIRELVSGRKPVTIDGPPGSGKPRIASFLHVLGKQRSNAFVECFCAREIPEEICELLIDDQGSFGRFVDLAENGTLAIHNIECLSDDLQNAFAERFDELGKRLNLLVLSDEHLDDLLDTNRIQLELYFRLSHTVLSIPSLASRREDLPGLIDFIASSREHSGLPIIPSSTQLRAFKSKINEWDCDNNLDGLLRQFREHFEVERCLY